VGEKMFCITTIDDGAEDVSIKVSDDDFNTLTERDGIIPAPYMARNKWVRVERYKYLKPKEWPHYLRESYELIKSKLPKKLRESLK
jgi:predicted DNA-binding protein (MmcQ/YjbR family)